MLYRTGKADRGLLAGIVVGVAILFGAISILFFDSAGRNGSGLPPEYTYDISEYTKIAPELILYKQVGSAIPTGLKLSHSIAVQGSIYVAGDFAIVKLGAAGKIEKNLDLDASPTCLAVDANGRIFVGVQDTVILLGADGTKQTLFSVPNKNAILTSIVLDNEHLFVADAVNGLIYCYDRNNNLVNTIGQKDPAKEDHARFVIPSPYFDIALASDGLLRVVDPGRHKIIAFTIDGHREWVWGDASPKIVGFSGCCNPVNFAILPDGLFVTVEKGLVRVKIYDSEGKFLGVVAGPEQLELHEPQRVCDTPDQCQSKGFDVAVDNEGKIYVLDTVNNVVRIFEKK